MSINTATRFPVSHFYGRAIDLRTFRFKVIFNSLFETVDSLEEVLGHKQLKPDAAYKLLRKYLLDDCTQYMHRQEFQDKDGKFKSPTKAEIRSALKLLIYTYQWQQCCWEEIILKKRGD